MTAATQDTNERAANNVVVASTHAANASISRIYRPTQINEKTIRTRLDTGADVTLLSKADWIAMGRPMLRPPRITMRYECSFVIDGHHGRGTRYVADTPSSSMRIYYRWSPRYAT
ncbi:unnamed protein product [Haemonchus placei]|uniref:Peptidase A2 domain-containing protein n=1 Tax=Haemonchus placei TaxID=6290 RepID=A0A0N4X5N4_HAEPC|nr:unnamed protein product [Haemonchus placei]